MMQQQYAEGVNPSDRWSSIKWWLTLLKRMGVQGIYIKHCPFAHHGVDVSTVGELHQPFSNYVSLWSSLHGRVVFFFFFKINRLLLPPTLLTGNNDFIHTLSF